MSYGYNKYSPYFNQQREQNGTNQFSYQTPSTGQGPSYTAPASNYNGQQRSPPSNDLSQYAPHSSRYPGTGTEAYHDARSNSYNGMAEHTTGLNGLAYASSLRSDQSSNEQERASLQKIADFNRSQSRSSPRYYGQKTHQRSESSIREPESHNAKVNRTVSPYQPYVSQASVADYRTHHAPQPSVSGVQPTSQHVPQPTRQAAYYESSAVHQSQKQNTAQNEPRPPEVDKRGSVSQALNDQPARPKLSAMPQQSSFNSTRGNDTRIHNQHQPSNDKPEDERMHRLNPINNAINDHGHGQHSQSTPPSNPTTIDPSKVFNLYEYQRRQNAAVAEAKVVREKAAAEAEQRRKSEQMTASTKLAQDEGFRKERMEVEMKLMLEKMREYKSKDPALFSQIWEQVKKAQPPTALPASKDVAVASPRPASTSTAQQSSAASIPMNPSTTPVPQASSIPASSIPVSSIPASSTPALSIPASSIPASSVPASSVPVAQDRGKPSAPRRKRKQVKSSTEPSVRGTSEQSSVQGPPEGYVRAGEDQNSISSQQTEKARTSENMTDAGSRRNESTASQSTSAPPRSSGQTHWPEEDKWALAIAARETLLSHPANRNKQIRSYDIRCLLDQGPSYNELCSMLEQKGFVVERTPFAQQLLDSVPRLKQQQQPPPPPPPQDPPSVPTNSIPQTSGKSNSTSSRKKITHPTKSIQKPKAPQITATNNTLPNGTSAPAAPMYGMLTRKPQHQQPQLQLSAQQTKPKFVDAPKTNKWIVRLTGDPFRSQTQKDYQTPQSNTSEFSHAHPHIDVSIQPTKQQMAKKRSFAEIVDLTLDMNSDEERERARAKQLCQHEQSRSKELESPQVKTIKSRVSTAQSDEEDVEVARIKSRFRPEQEQLRKADVVKPLNPADALQRTSYDPRTIADDILIAVGKHPYMKPLNWHLMGLRTIFEKVDNTSDLSTLDWELLDPGGPPMPESPEIVDLDKPEQKPPAQIEDIEPAVIVPGSNHKSAAVKSSDNSQVHPNSSPSNTRRFTGLSIDALPRQQHKSSDSGDLKGDISLLVAGESGGDNSSERYRTDLSLPITPNTSTSRQVSRVNGSAEQVQRRGAGRPRGSKNKQPRKSRGSTSSNNLTPTQPSTPMTSNSAFRKPSSTPLRSSGLKNEISRSSGFAVVIPSPEKENRSGESKFTHSKRRKNQVYKCRWKGCSGELHNLDTLRKHVYGHIHDFDEEENRTLYCLWEGCETSDGRSPLPFRSATSWHRHMDGRHLDPFAWELGDGPSPHPSDPDLDFLSDSQHRQVTPQPGPHSRRPDPLIVPPAKAADMGDRRTAIRAYHAAHGNASDEQKAQTIFDSHLERRRVLGAGVTKGGTAFVNEERRALLQHDPYHLRLVSDEAEDGDE
ncbi:MAG: hypothetical protein Q9191_005619 [Dirinaria sp. TL-2023a]